MKPSEEFCSGCNDTLCARTRFCKKGLKARPAKNGRLPAAERGPGATELTVTKGVYVTPKARCPDYDKEED